MELNKGMKFSSYEEFKNYFREYCDTNYVQFWTRESKSLKKCFGHIRRAAVADEKLKYYTIKFCCIFGGRHYVKHRKSYETKERRTKTYRQGCDARIKLLLSNDAKHLEVVEANLVHNHVITKEIYESLHHQRRLPPEAIEKVCKYMELKANKRYLQQLIAKETGKKLKLSDLNNIAQKFNITGYADKERYKRTAICTKIDTVVSYLQDSLEAETTSNDADSQNFDSSFEIDFEKEEDLEETENLDTDDEKSENMEMEHEKSENLEMEHETFENLEMKQEDSESLEMQFEDSENLVDAVEKIKEEDSSKAPVTEQPIIVKIPANVEVSVATQPILKTPVLFSPAQAYKPTNYAEVTLPKINKEVPHLEKYYSLTTHPETVNTVQLPLVYVTGTPQPRHSSLMYVTGTPQTKHSPVMYVSETSQPKHSERPTVSQRSEPVKKNKKSEPVKKNNVQIPVVCVTQTSHSEKKVPISKTYKAMQKSIEKTSVTSNTVSSTKNSTSNCKHDEYDAYGQYLASEIRSVPDARQRSILKVKLQLLIFKAHQSLLTMDD